MQRSSRKAWVLLSVFWMACSLVTDFDRSKVERVGEGGTETDRDSSVNAGGGDRDAGSGSGGRADAGFRPDTGAPVEAGPSDKCSNNEECSMSQLCCDGLCVPTSEARCSACDRGCAPSGNACEDRSCACGELAACGGQAPYCSGEGAGSCAECRDATDCQGQKDGKQQCVAGRCAQCDPNGNSGCEGNRPICNPATLTCEACSLPDNCPGNPVCTPSGACGGCGPNDAADCTTPTAPICDLTSNPTLCRGCASDGECSKELSLPYCVNNQRCSSCKPVANAADPGCDINSPSPACRLNDSGQYVCQACQNSDQCSNEGSRDLCGTGANAGKCVECNTNADCADEARPFCDGSGTCRPCGNAPAPNVFCSVRTLLARPFCDSASGACVSCRNNNDCEGSRGICDGRTHQCRGCTTSTEAVDCPSPANPACNPNTGSCVPCRPGGPSACSAPNDTCANFACVDCQGNTGCSRGQSCRSNQCVCNNDNACPGGHCNRDSGMCVGCVNDTHCTSDAAPLCNGDTQQCVPCTLGMDDLRCAQKLGGGGVCATSGVCRKCDSVSNHGCENMSATPICVSNTSCAACANDGQCAAAGPGYVCTAQGACAAPIPCDPAKNNEECADPNHPTCDMNVCK